jgi:hypothetical protein
MIAYIDSSVVLRIILGEPKALHKPGKWKRLISSEILKIECFRTLDRIRMSIRLSNTIIADRNALLHTALKSIGFVKFSKPIVQTACQSFPIVLKSLDAIHLSTALVLREKETEPLIFLTHDEQLGRAAASMGFEVEGLD